MNHETDHQPPSQHKLSVLIPVYNEKDTVLEVLDRVKRAPVGLEKELVVVDDASTDGTTDLLRTVDDNVVHVYFHGNNTGKGGAVRTAMQQASGDILLIQDADLEYDPKDYPALLEPIVSGRADVVIGTRFLGGAHRVLYYRHYLGNRIITSISNFFTNLNLTDMEAGYKVFTREALDGISIESDRFGLEPELIAKVAKKGCRVYEVPIGYSGRTYDEGKKITWKDGMAAVWWILKYNLFR